MVGLVIPQQVIDADQQAARDGHNRFRLAPSPRESVVPGEMNRRRNWQSSDPT